VRLPDVLLVDLDDTIIDISASADACWRDVVGRAAPSLGVEASALCAAITLAKDWFWTDRVRNQWGRFHLQEASRLIVEETLARLGIADADHAHRIADEFRATREAYIALFPGAVALLDELRSGGVRLALVTNGRASTQRAKIERFELAPRFEAILIEEEVGAGKPDPSVYRAALGRLGARASLTWMVGDDLERDVDGPQRLGIAGIWIDHGGQGVPAPSSVRPARIVRSLSELAPPPADGSAVRMGRRRG
jgi:putative hydrolase of the HAD superfamily